MVLRSRSIFHGCGKGPGLSWQKSGRPKKRIALIAQRKRAIGT